MDIEGHIAMARSIEASLLRCTSADYEMRIEGAMLAGTHWLNALLHKLGTTPPQADVFHSYLLTVNEFRRLAVAAERPLLRMTRGPAAAECREILWASFGPEKG